MLNQSKLMRMCPMIVLRIVLSSSGMFGGLNHTEPMRNNTVILVPINRSEWFTAGRLVEPP